MDSNQLKNISNDAIDRKKISFLHLSDIHVGINNQGWLWPAFKTAFIDDIKKLFVKTGGWDVVIFSGDLTQQASDEEFNKFTEILKEIWCLFKDLGFNPAFFPVPGNHDLIRPDVLNPAAIVFEQFWQKKEIQDLFWNLKNTEYKELIIQSYVNYTNWLDRLVDNGVNLPRIKKGNIPGDISSIVEINGVRIGLVGLNSAWLQLSNADYKGRLHVDARQLLDVTDQDPDKWCAKNDFNLLVTHHPVDWLSSSSQSFWKSEIFTCARFDSHLHGHMHLANSITIAEGGFSSRRSKQCASLFGLERIGNNDLERIHGYSLCQLIELNNGSRIIRHWPRKNLVGKDGANKIAPDFEFNICDDGYFEESYSLKSQLVLQSEPISSVISPHERMVHSFDFLNSIRLVLPISPAYAEVRKVELNISVSALKDNRALWLVSDWGLGSEYFVRSIKERFSIENENIYQLDFQNYFNQTEILTGVQEQVGCGFEELCGLISAQNSCILLLDDVPISEGKDKDLKKLQLDVEK